MIKHSDVKHESNLKRLILGSFYQVYERKKVSNIIYCCNIMNWNIGLLLLSDVSKFLGGIT